MDYLVFDTRARASFLKYKFALAYSRLSSSSSSRRTANTRSNEFKRCNSSASDAIQASRACPPRGVFERMGERENAGKEKKIFDEFSSKSRHQTRLGCTRKKKCKKTRWVFFFLARARRKTPHTKGERRKERLKRYCAKRCPRRYRLSSSRIRRFLIARRGEEGEEMERKFFRVLRLLVLR